jgi:hypothetical protein
MFSNFVIGLLVILVVLYLTKFISGNEGFRVFNSNSNIYESIGAVPNKMLYLSPPNHTQPNVDYQDWLNEVSGYDAGTRGYNNPVYAADVAAGLDTN